MGAADETARERAVDGLEQRLGYRFRDRDLLNRALTHRSWAHDHGTADHFERLEFLGDAVVGLAATLWLQECHPEADEGELSRRRAALVSAPSLATLGGHLGIGPALRLSVGEERAGGRGRASILADAFEALAGALMIDAGFEQTRRILQSSFEQWRGGADGGARARDSKTALQEWTQARGGELPEYVILRATGADHERRFLVEVRVAGEARGRGEAGSKKEAQQQAAARALEKLQDPAFDPDGG